MNYDRDTLKLISHRSKRGIRTSDLVCSLQDYQTNINLLRESSYPELVIGFQKPSECSASEWLSSHLFFFEESVKAIESELARRSNAQYQGNTTASINIINTIKEMVNIGDVLEWYTDVIFSRNVQKYRCKLHGEDRHPSGQIFQDTNKAWCFTCNKGGDVFDIVQLFEKKQLPWAIHKLATSIGLDVSKEEKPPILHSIGKEDLDTIKGGIIAINTKIDARPPYPKPLNKYT